MLYRYSTNVKMKENRNPKNPYPIAQRDLYCRKKKLFWGLKSPETILMKKQFTGGDALGLERKFNAGPWLLRTTRIGAIACPIVKSFICCRRSPSSQSYGEGFWVVTQQRNSVQGFGSRPSIRGALGGREGALVVSQALQGD